MWCIPPKANAAFACNMEDVLDTYTRPIDPKKPLICMDETNKQLLSDPLEPLPPQPGSVARYDYHYEREGVANLFMFFAPLLGQRWVKVTQQRTACVWAETMREVADTVYPDAEKIVVVLDNLNTHSPVSFYQAFPPAEARRLVERFEFHYTPKHGSWLNMAEIELSVLIRQCLAGRIPNQEMLSQQVQAWQKERNEQVVKVHWHFTTQDARQKLKSLYPKYES
jgi:hypothetical protein